MQTSKRGFSLVELSVVIIIIGLLTAAVVGGLAIQKAARFQAVISDLSKYKDSAVQFKTKYYYWPGDQPDTYNFWNDANSMGGTSCSNDQSSLVTGGCNGDGNNKIALCNMILTNVLCKKTEATITPKVLVASGFITGKYNGATSSLTAFPNAPLDGLAEMNLSKPVYVWLYNNSLAKNTIAITDLISTGVFYDYLTGALRPDYALAIDKKIDDGVANNGFVRGFNRYGIAGNSVCLDSSSQYDVSNNTSRRCILTLNMD